MGAQARQKRQRHAAAHQPQAPVATPVAPSRAPVAVVAGALAALAGAAWLAASMRRSRVPPPVDDAPLRMSEAEPNDSRPQLVPRLPARISGTLATGDRDRFRIVVSAPGGTLLHASLAGIAGAHLEIDRAGGNAMTAVTAPSRIEALGLVAGTYDAVVTGGPAGVTGSYVLELATEPWGTGLEWEPNDDTDHATEMARVAHDSGDIDAERVSGWWSRPGDVDCFSVPLAVPAAGAQLRVELSAPDGMAPHVALLDQGDSDPGAKVAPKQLAEADAPAGGKAVLPAVGARSWETRYYVCTSAQGARYGERYTLKTRLYTPSGPFEFEPDDTAATAAALPRNVLLSGYLTPGDVDWYRISSASGKISHDLDVEVTPPPDVAVEVTLLTAKGEVLVTKTGTPGKVVDAEYYDATFARVRAVSGSSLDDAYTIIAH